MYIREPYDSLRPKPKVIYWIKKTKQIILTGSYFNRHFTEYRKQCYIRLWLQSLDALGDE